MASKIWYLRELVLLVLIFNMIPCYGQEYHFKHVDIDEGLPSRMVFRSIEDDKGNRWYLTDKGIVRFDGQKWKSFGPEDGYMDLAAFFIKKDSKGNIWIISTNFHLYKFTNNRFFRIQCSEEPAWLDINEKDQVVVLSRSMSFFIVAPNLSCEWLCTFPLAVIPTKDFIGTVGYTFTCIKAGSFLLSTSIGVFIMYDQFKKYKLIEVNQTFSNQVVARVFRTSTGKIWYSTQKGLYEYVPSSLSKNLVKSFNKNEIYDVFEDTIRGSMLVGTFRGLYELRYGKNYTGQLILNKAVLAISKANSGTVVLTTSGDGLFTSEMRAKYFSKAKYFMNENIEYLRVSNGRVIGFSISGKIFTTSDNTEEIVFEKYKERNFNGRVFGVSYSLNSDSLFISSDQVFTFSNDKISKFWHNTKSTSGLFWITSNQDSIPLPLYKVLLQRQKEEELSSFFFYLSRNNILLSPYRIVKAIDKSIFEQSSNKGLVEVVLSGNDVIKHYLYRNITNVSDIVQTADGSYLIATKNSGVYLAKEGVIQRRFSVIDGLASDACNKIIKHKGQYWICTNKGISIMRLTNKVNFITYDESNLLVNNEVRDLVFHKGFVFVATGEGLSFFPESFSLNQQSPKVFLTQFQVNNRDTPLQSYYELPYTYNNINVSYIHPDPLSTKKVQYRYVLYGMQNDTGYTEQTELRFSSLQSGEYELKIWARNAHGEWSDVPAEIKFSIAVPYWRTYWFFGLLLIGIVGIISYGYWVYFRNKKKELAYQERLSESERKALRLQMNPHFIFNTLNSLQSFILQHNPLEANKYISKLATLMRWVMIYAERQTVSLSAEIRFLEVYIELEHLRMEQAFSYHWDIDESINADRMFVPALLIQPIIENAIKYGLSDTRKPGVLKIGMYKRENVLEVVIEDNGKGRAEVKREQDLSGKEYASTGIKSINERLKLLLGMDYKENPVKIIDLKDQEGNPEGTKVVLIIPYESD